MNETPAPADPESLGEAIARPSHASDLHSREEEVLRRIEEWRKRRPRLKDEFINSAHGAGGKASAALIDAVFLEAFRNKTLEAMSDGAVLELPSGDRVAFSTDSFVVKPLRFPGGSIGDLAVNGTVNDLAMMGATPQWISAAFVLEDGFSIEELRSIVADMAKAAAKAGVQVVTGDTKVVNKGAADGVYITTAGVGVVPQAVHLDPKSVRPGDKVLVSGHIGDHGVAVLIARGDLALEADIPTDSAPLGELVDALLTAAPQTRFLRDPTRGGVATVVNELARDAEIAVVLHESALPIRGIVNGACEILGIDPLYVANEGKLVAVVPPDQADAALAAMQAHPYGTHAAVIGEVREDPPGIVILNTGFGGNRIVDMLVGDPLPRIC
ncbi:MAG: hydrogenase expression/formation protein HypE [Actinomycetota bacterium]|nr:hydrogenase expression/formation protein HypE [Actinomycetota bacterium]